MRARVTSGMVSSGPGMTASTEGLVEFLVTVLLGAFCGLLVGFIVSQIARFASMSAGRNYGGFRWTIYCVLLGAALFAVLAITRDDET